MSNCNCLLVTLLLLSLLFVASVALERGVLLDRCFSLPCGKVMPMCIRCEATIYTTRWLRLHIPGSFGARSQVSIKGKGLWREVSTLRSASNFLNTSWSERFKRERQRYYNYARNRERTD